MCIICVELDKERMTKNEALRAIGELSMSDKNDTEHLEELKSSLEGAPELPQGSGELYDKLRAVWRGM
jgi:hypothetical protein